MENNSETKIKIKVDTSELDAALAKLENIKLPSMQVAEAVAPLETGILEVTPEDSITLKFDSIHDWKKDVDSAIEIITQLKEKYPEVRINTEMKFRHTDKYNL